jgi:hypothetical protein
LQPGFEHGDNDAAMSMILNNPIFGKTKIINFNLADLTGQACIVPGMTSSLFYINGTSVQLTIETWSTGKWTIFDILSNLIIHSPRIDVTKSMINIQSAWQLYVSLVLNGNYWAIIYGLLILYLIYSTIAILSPDRKSSTNLTTPTTTQKEEEEEEPIILRDFTPDQLRLFNGEGGKPIYISLKRDVFDVSKATEYYGKGAG